MNHKRETLIVTFTLSNSPSLVTKSIYSLSLSSLNPNDNHSNELIPCYVLTLFYPSLPLNKNTVSFAPFHGHHLFYSPSQLNSTHWGMMNRVPIINQVSQSNKSIIIQYNALHYLFLHFLHPSIFLFSNDISCSFFLSP